MDQASHDTASPLAPAVSSPQPRARSSGTFDRFRPLLILLPTASVALGAAVSAAEGASSTSVLALGLCAVTMLAATAWTLLVVRGAVRQLGRQLDLVAAGGLPDSGTLGRRSLLAGIVTPLDRVVEALTSAKEAATIDRLTRIANRPALLEQAFNEVERANRYRRPIAFAFIDIDHFKAINDGYGHEAGDVVLRGVAAVFRANLRATDFVGRYGGEEFMLVLPETTADEATAVAEKLRLLVLKARFASGQGVDLSVSVSIGIAGSQGQNVHVADLIRDADAAMYSAKSLGRNQTFVFAEPDDDARVPRAPISAEGRARATEVGEAARRAAERALAAVINPLPHYRGKPSPLIAAIAVRVAGELGLPQSEVERIRVASLLHDIGKVAVPAEILDKPGPLTTSEWQSVIQHPRVGQVIIDQVSALQDAGAIILHHHERFAGHGYPHGLRGNEIPLGARIVAIADAYDAMIQNRPYRGAVSHQEAITELRVSAGRQFDPELVRLFCDLYEHQAPLADPSLLIADGSAEEPSTRRRRRSRAASA